MSINNNFYKTVNELVARATGGTSTEIVDYRSFIDVGKTLTSGNIQDLCNAFASEIANKVKLTINVVRSYEGKLKSLVRAQIDPQSVIEIITNGFYETRSAAFVNLFPEGQTDYSVDQYITSKGVQNVHYFTKENSFQINITIQAIELKGAFSSPDKMEAFLNGKIAYALNSKELGKENARRGLLGELIQELTATGVDSATTADTPAQRYDLVTLFNGITGSSLDADSALYNGEFVQFAVAVMKKVRANLSNVSTKYNASGVKTFTPDTVDDKKTIIHSAFASAMTPYIRVPNPNGELGVLGDYEEVAYWQDEDKPFIVSSQVADPVGDADPVEVESPAILGLVFDKYAIGEYPEIDDIATTPYNARGKYTNDWISVQSKYIRLKDANAVVFTLA